MRSGRWTFDNAREVLQQRPGGDHILLYDLGTSHQDGPALMTELRQRTSRAKILVFGVAAYDQAIKILQVIAEGLDNKAIAQKLYLYGRVGGRARPRSVACDAIQKLSGTRAALWGRSVQAPCRKLPDLASESRAVRHETARGAHLPSVAQRVMRKIFAISVLLAVALLAVAAPALAAGDLELRVAENFGPAPVTYAGINLMPPTAAPISGQDQSTTVVGGQGVR